MQNFGKRDELGCFVSRTKGTIWFTKNRLALGKPVQDDALKNAELWPTLELYHWNASFQLMYPTLPEIEIPCYKAVFDTQI